MGGRELFGVLVASWLAGCTTTRNPNVCCQTEAECARVQFDRPAPCASGACVGNLCVASGCDGDEDCSDPIANTCVAGACVDARCEAAGGRIVFLSNEDGDDDVFSMNADGTDRIRLTSTGGFERSPTWSPDGSQIAFLGEVAGVRDAFVIPSRGGTAVNITNSSSAEELVSWSPTGARLAMLVRTIPGSGPTALAVAAPDGQDLRFLTSGTYSEPSWAPDGSKLVYVVDENRLWATAEDGSGPTPITTAPVLARAPRIAPSGTRLAFLASPNSFEIYVGALSSSQFQNVSTSSADEREIEWSPDGREILFVRDEAGNREVWSMDATGAGQRNLTTSPGVDEHAQWSPDGQFILFETVRDGNRELYRMERDGSRPTNLTRSAAAEHSARWGPCPR